MSTKETHLGDGLYASFDGYMIALRAPREEGDHFVYLEDFVLKNFLAWCEEQGLIEKKKQ
jgi:hypothetical protein